MHPSHSITLSLLLMRERHLNDINMQALFLGARKCTKRTMDTDDFTPSLFIHHKINRNEWKDISCYFSGQHILSKCCYFEYIKMAIDRPSVALTFTVLWSINTTRSHSLQGSFLTFGRQRWHHNHSIYQLAFAYKRTYGGPFWVTFICGYIYCWSKDSW